MKLETLEKAKGESSSDIVHGFRTKTSRIKRERQLETRIGTQGDLQENDLHNLEVVAKDLKKVKKELDIDEGEEPELIDIAHVSEFVAQMDVLDEEFKVVKERRNNMANPYINAKKSAAVVSFQNLMQI